MTILHTSWRGNGFLFWGENEAPQKSLLTCALSETACESPFNAGVDHLRRQIKGLLWETESELPAVSAEIFLPTKVSDGRKVPVPSKEFLGGDGDGRLADAELVLLPWRIDAIELTWRQAFSLLGVCGEKRLSDGFFAGEDLLACAETFRYVGALVARGKFLPDLCDTGEGEYQAYWRPVIDGVEWARFSALAARLPPSIFCGASGFFAGQILLEMTDQLVRCSVATTLSRAHAEKGKYYCAHDAWFAALRGERRTIRWDSVEDLAALRQAVCRWSRPVDGGSAKNETLRFLLEEPQGSEASWTLRVLAEEPKQATEASCESDGQRQAVEMRLDEHQLTALGQAATLFVPLSRAECVDGSLGCVLSTEEAHAFMTSYAVLLEASGYTVSLPPWWNHGAVQGVSLEAEVSSRSADEGAACSLDEKVAVNWRVTLNGEPITAHELEMLLQAESPLVYFRGQWLRVDVPQLQEALRVWKRKNGESQSAMDVVRLLLGTTESHYGLEVKKVCCRGWLDPFLKKISGEQPFEVLPCPEKFCGELRPYQERGFSWLAFLRKWGFGACLADDMGLGKTIQTLAFLLHEKAKGEKRPVLLVGPMSVLGNWLREARRFAPELTCLLHHGAQRWHGDAFLDEAKSVDVVVTSYHLLYRDYSDLRKVAWAGIVLDEAQNIKNPDTHQAQAARALTADYRIALTGTPMENHVGDMWSIMDFLNPGLLGRRSVFRERFFRPIQSGTDPGARVRLRRVTTPFILRRLKTDKQIISDLPEKTENKVYCPLTREQAALYEEVLEAFNRDVEQADGISRRGMILAVLTRLKQVCNHPENYLGHKGVLANRSGKLIRLEEMLEEVFSRNESALVFTQYAEMGALLKRHLCHTFAREVPFLCGSVPRKERDRLVHSFQEAAQPTAFVLSLKAGGIGLNLTRANHVFHFDRWWNPAVEDQATDRAFRIGQVRNVMVHKFICGGTLEDRIDALIEHKTGLANEVVSSGEAFLTEFSNEALREILSLSETAVMDETIG